MAIASINPASGETVKTYREMTPAETEAAIAEAHETWRSWRATPFAERARLMLKTSEILRGRSQPRRPVRMSRSSPSAWCSR